ncbi:siderophore-interacting protein [Georgenia halophila]|uniref:Siderophore-interacting protein n=1 Tax=Georgenia halophila TaxID=620889 RepID=A0ABP8LCJ7_9MICO
MPRTVTVAARREVSPNLVRVTITGEELEKIDPTPHTDRYVKLVMAEPEEPEARPVVRTYTVRAVREREWDLDIVLHGEVGYGGPWATRVRPGDEVTFLGPGGGYAPDPAASWHLLVGDDSALPAIAAAIEAMPGDAVVRAFVEIATEADRQEIAGPADTAITWLVRGNGTLEDAVIAAYARGDLPDGVPQAFLHGEAGCVRVLRRWARAELGVTREELSASGYWRRGVDDEAWRTQKRDWMAAVEKDDEAIENR